MKPNFRCFNRSSIAALCGVILSVLPCAWGQNLVTNPGFEANKTVPGFPIPPEAPLTGWTIGEDLGAAPPNPPQTNKVEGTGTPRYIDNGAPSGGDIYVAFSGTATINKGFGTLTRPIATVPGEEYILSFWLANPIDDVSNLNNEFKVSWGGVLLDLASPRLTEIGNGSTFIVTPNPTNWFQVTVSNLSVTGPSTELIFSARNNDWATLLDNVSVTVVPEPTVASIFGVGALVLGMRRNRRVAAV